MPKILNIHNFEVYSQLLQVRHKIQRKLISFAPAGWYEAQKIFHTTWRQAEKEGRLLWFLILKARQEGISTYSEARIFHNTATHLNTNSLILADVQKRSEYIYQMCKTFHEHLPPQYQPEARYSSKKELIFDTKEGKGLKSAIYVSTALDEYVGQGQTIHNLHVSEASSFPYLADVFTSLLPAIPQTKDGIVIVESTAKGAGAEFHQEWLRAKSGQSIFYPIFIPWYVMSEYALSSDSQLFPEFDPKGRYTAYEKKLIQIAKKDFNIDVPVGQIIWRRHMIANTYRGDEDGFNQEFPSSDDEAFIVAGDTAFNRKRLKEVHAGCIPPKIKADIIIDSFTDYDLQGHIQETENGHLWIWKEPTPGHIYRIGVDPAGGFEGRDYTALQVLDEVEKEQVAEYHGHLDPMVTAHAAVVLAKYYNEGKMVIEINYGMGTQIEAKRYYWHFYHHKYLDRIADKPTEKIGFMTTWTFKKELIGYGEHVFNVGTYKIYSTRLADELLTFIKRGGQELAQAASGCHDDLVMSWLITIYTSYQDKDYIGYNSEKVVGEGEMLRQLKDLGVDSSVYDGYTQEEETEAGWMKY